MFPERFRERFRERFGEREDKDAKIKLRMLQHQRHENHVQPDERTEH